MKNNIILIILLNLLFSFNGISQIKEFDKLEMLYAQGHYSLVLKKANRILDNPEFDYSQVPKFYKSIAIMQLCQNELYLRPICSCKKIK
jgi:hypothetical protein